MGLLQGAPETVRETAGSGRGHGEERGRGGAQEARAACVRRQEGGYLFRYIREQCSKVQVASQVQQVQWNKCT